MNTHRFKVIGIFALAVVLTFTMTACDLLDDDEEEPAVETYNLTVNYEGLGETTPQQGTHEFEENTMVDLEAVPYDEGWEFDYWEGPVSNRYEASTQIFMDDNKEVKAVFVESDEASYNLTINYEGLGSTQPSMGTRKYDADELVEIVAEPADGWEFDYWRGDVMEEDEEKVSILMDGDKVVTAVFDQKEEEEPEEDAIYELTIKREGEGEIKPSPGTYTHEANESVDLVAEPAEGWEFDYWRGNVMDSESPVTSVFMEEDTEVTAIFAEETKDKGFAGGTGTRYDPYIIETAEQLDRVRNHLDAHFELNDDIDLTGFSDGSGWLPLGKTQKGSGFTGSLDGKGYIIENLVIDRSTSSRLGLFSGLGEEGEISNLILEDVNITASYKAGSLTGVTEGTIGDVEIREVYIEGENDIAGLSGEVVETGTISDAEISDVEVSGINRTGGLAGQSVGVVEGSNISSGLLVEGVRWTGGLVGENHGVIENSRVESGSVIEKEGHQHYYDFGGLAGKNYGTIFRCSAGADVTAENAHAVGGLVGPNINDIEESFAAGNIVGNDMVGGLAGRHQYRRDGVIENSYATGDVSGEIYVGGLTGDYFGDMRYNLAVGNVEETERAGGLTGYRNVDEAPQDDFVIEFSYWDIEESGRSYSAGGEGRTGYQLKTGAADDTVEEEVVYENWDEEVWDFGSENDYPGLEWE